jgi:hypothetical protein
MSMSKTNPEQGTREKLYAMLRGAHDGTESLTWFHNLVIRAGYTKVQIGVDALLVTVNQLVKIWGLSMRTVRCMIAEGLPCARQGVGAEPSLFDLAIC